MTEVSAAIPDWDGPEDVELRLLAARLAEHDGEADAAGVFPEGLWAMLVASGSTRWALPDRFANSGGDRPGLVRRYARVAEGSLTAAFILTQHDAAVRRLVLSSGTGRKTADFWLDRIAANEAFATVGISQLTTSRRHGAQAMIAREHAGGFVLDGVMPWVTAAERADVFVTGGVLDDGRQMMAILPRERAGVSVRPAFDLAALGASCTSEVACEGVVIRPEEVLAGPAMDVMSTPGLAGTGGLETSAVAMGQARAALVALAKESTSREDLIEPAESLFEAWRELASKLMASAENRPEAPPSASIRVEANALVLRATQAYLTARKGSGFVKTEPAQRWARQALFFLVWSCPTPVARAAIRDLAGLCPG